MKRIIAVAFLAVIVSINTFAQTEHSSRFEVNIGGGGAGYVLGYCGGPVSHFSVGGEFRYTPIKWVSVGLIAALHDSYPDADYFVEDPDAEAETTYEANLMLMLYGNWLTREKVKIYSGVGYGTMGGFVDADGKPSHGIQVTPVGVSYGKRLFGFAELGMGWSFFPARAGIGFRF